VCNPFIHRKIEEKAMVQISKKDKGKVLEAIRLGDIDTAGLALPNLAE